MDKIYALIIEDEPSAIATLKKIIHKLYPEEFSFLGSTGFVQEAVNLVMKHIDQLDVIFLDVELKDHETAFNFLEELNTELDEKELTGHFEIIYYSSHKRYALEAMNNGNGFFYILKPPEEGQVTKAIYRLKQKRQTSTEPLLEDMVRRIYEQISSPVKRFIIKHVNNNSFELIDFDEIVSISTKGENFTEVSYSEDNGTSFKSKIHADGILSVGNLVPPSFFQIHRSHIINLNKIKSVYRKTDSEYLQMQLKDLNNELSRQKNKMSDNDVEIQKIKKEIQPKEDLLREVRETEMQKKMQKKRVPKRYIVELINGNKMKVSIPKQIEFRKLFKS